ncbi:FUSC family protein [Kocuria sp.]|uniref:FUSC family protein n=1 Tax=Kocuria sp. TaxID=1871328 RepID=UPI0026E07987|nr:FUSC family protein [Kocuria sp.]MDO5617853.1 FUSC family protein [Kocuria sp.]
MGVGLLLTALFVGPAQATMGLLGAMAGNAGRDDPFRQRMVTLILVGVATQASILIGLLIAPHAWLVPVVITVLTTLVVWVWHALAVGAPGPTTTLFACAFGTYLGARGYSVAEVLPVSLLTWSITAVVSLLLVVVKASAPKHQAVRTARESVAAYVDAVQPGAQGSGTSDADMSTLRSRAWVMYNDAWAAVRSGLKPGAEQHSEQGQELQRQMEALHDQLLAATYADPHSVLGISAAPDGGHRTTEPPTGLPAMVGLVPLGRPGWKYLLRTSLNPGARAWLIAQRAALAVLIASVSVLLLHVGHPYWAVLSALIILHMQTGRTELTVRAAHRVVGTGIGVVLYLGFALAHPGPWLVLGIVVVALYGLELMAPTNYAIATVCVTGLALLMSPVTSDAQMESLIRDRLVETVVGVSAAVLVIWLIGRKAAIRLVRRQYRMTLNCIVDVLIDLTGQARGNSLRAAEHRRNLIFEVGRASSILATARTDDPSSLAPWSELHEEIAGLAFDVTAAGWSTAADQAAAQQALQQLRATIATLPAISSRNIHVEGLAQQVAEVHRDFATSH